MPESLPLPIRVLVKGPSTVNWMVPMGGPRTNFTFPRAIEAELAKQGHPSRVEAKGMASERAKTLLGSWQREVLNFSPDVIVVLTMMETVHLFLPRWLERHANSLKSKDRWLTNLYRKRILRPAWKALARLQRKLDTVVDPTIRKSVPRRAVSDMEKYIRQVQKVGSPLVLVVDHVPNEIVARWFPGMNPRLEVMVPAVEEMVRRINKPNVRMFPLSELIDKHFDGEIKPALPDGLHYSPAFHRVIGQQLAYEILDWAEDQPHLAVDGGRAGRPESA
jgi:hypothetical protein